jgi:hypothetical protein
MKEIILFEKEVIKKNKKTGLKEDVSKTCVGHIPENNTLEEINTKEYKKYLPEIFTYIDKTSDNKNSMNLSLTENSLQQQCIEYAKQLCHFKQIKILIQHSRNENYNGDLAKIRAKNIGVHSGYPDLTIHLENFDIYIEFKTSQGSLRPNQFYTLYQLCKVHKKKFVYVIKTKEQFQLMLEDIITHYKNSL